MALDKPRRILVVDDERIIVEFLSFMLRARLPNCVVGVALTGDEALRMALTDRPHVVLLDLHIPGRNGFEVCSTLRATPELAFTRIIALTGDPAADVQRRIMDLGAVSCVKKPLNYAEFLEQIQHHAQAAVEQELAGTPAG